MRFLSLVALAILFPLMKSARESAPIDLAEMYPIDAHAHVFKEDAALTRLFGDLNLHFVDILVIDNRDSFFKQLEPQYSDALKLLRTYPGRIDICTTFSPYGFEQPGFTRRVIRHLNDNFNQGAVAVKIYKTIGMQIKTKSGRYLLPDDSVFDPIYDQITFRNRTLVAHLAEPTSCWQPPNPESPDYSYYNAHPEEYAYLHRDWPSKQAILNSRDRMLEKHPSLRVVGAHLGSMELDVDEIAKRFDRYPNFAVDTAARVQYLMLQPRQKVLNFLIKYQDRVLYGTDFDLEPQQDAANRISDVRATYLREWKYFATNEVIPYEGRNIQGLSLPSAVLQKLYHANALSWFPGLSANQSR